VVAYSEQGLLASVFSGMIADAEQLHEMNIDLSSDTPFPREECEAMIVEQLRAAAESVGFQRLTEVHAFWRQYGDREDYHDLLYAYTRSIP
jgi:hypothetical protein